MYADQVPVVTAEDMRRLWHRNIANGVEGIYERGFPLGNPLEKFQERRLRCLAESVLGMEVVAKLNAYRMRTFPEPGQGFVYGLTFWIKVLTTSQKIVFGWRSDETGDVSETGIRKRRLIETDVWPPPDYVPRHSRQQLMAHIEIPEILDYRLEVDPLGLADAPSAAGNDTKGATS